MGVFLSIWNKLTSKRVSVDGERRWPVLKGQTDKLERSKVMMTSKRSVVVDSAVSIGVEKDIDEAV